MTDRNLWVKQASEWARDLTQITLALAAICYASGFIITSVYLASYGVVQAELVRARYVLVGFVFLLFCFGIIVPTVLVCRLWEDVRKDLAPLRPSSIGSLIGFLLVVALVCFTNPLIFIGLSILSLSGPPWLPGAIATIGFREPLLHVGWRIIGESIRVLPSVGPALILGLIFTLIVQSVRAAEREARRTPATIIRVSVHNFWTQLRRQLFSREGLVVVLIKSLAQIWIFWVLLFICLELLSAVPSSAPTTQPPVPTTEALVRRVTFVSLALIGIPALFFTFTRTMRTNAEQEAEPSPEAKSDKKVVAGYLFLGSLLAAVALFMAACLIAVYTLAIFPALGYHVGGGALQPVTLSSENEKIQAIISEGDVETYLLDRSGHEYLFVFMSATGDYQVMEIGAENIDSIVYKRGTVESEVE